MSDKEYLDIEQYSDSQLVTFWKEVAENPNKAENICSSSLALVRQIVISELYTVADRNTGSHNLASTTLNSWEQSSNEYQKENIPEYTKVNNNTANLRVSDEEVINEMTQTIAWISKILANRTRESDYNPTLKNQ